MRHSVAMYSSAFETAGGMFIFAIIFLSIVVRNTFYLRLCRKLNKMHICFMILKNVHHISSTNTSNKEINNYKLNPTKKYNFIF